MPVLVGIGAAFDINSGMGKFDFLFHLGACSSTTETDAEYLRRNNFEYSRDQAAAALAANVRFVYASSAATYGDGNAGMDDADPRGRAAPAADALLQRLLLHLRSADTCRPS